MFKLRVITGSIMAVAFLLSLFLLPPIGFTVFITLVLLAGAWEWSNLSSFELTYQRIIYCLSVITAIGALAFYMGAFSGKISLSSVREVLLVACAWWAIALLWIQGYPSSGILWGARWIRALMGYLVLVPAWVALVYLYQVNNGPWFILLVMLTVFVADTGAYIFGKALGKRKLAKHVSPGKSWEGFLGGLFCCVVLAIAIHFLTHFGTWQSLLVVLLCTSSVSVVGDLLESMIKRHRGIKDSGHMLPGHGGMMDRLDSITAAAPVFVIGAILFGWVS
ncbi:MAG: phosphatidate cytidylyltransferase [Cellvibrionaceae bacterium]